MTPPQSLAREVRASFQTLRRESSPLGKGLVEVSGVLAEQLARELGAGAQPGAVRTGGDSPSGLAEVLVRVIAGEPTDADAAFVRAAEKSGDPVVLVQLWPQADWTRPFVLTPFVVECRAGEGFPIGDIAAKIVDAIDPSSTLAAVVPSVRRSYEKKVVSRSVMRVAALGALKRGASTRPLITLEQLRMVGRLSSVGGPGRSAAISAEPASLGAVAGVIFASGYALQGIARAATFVLPRPLANAAVAASGTWALAQAAKVYASRRSS